MREAEPHSVRARQAREKIRYVLGAFEHGVLDWMDEAALVLTRRVPPTEPDLPGSQAGEDQPALRPPPLRARAAARKTVTTKPDKTDQRVRQQVNTLCH